MVVHGFEEIVEGHRRLALDEHRFLMLNLMFSDELVEQEDFCCFLRESCWDDEIACYSRLDLFLVTL